MHDPKTLVAGLAAAIVLHAAPALATEPAGDAFQQPMSLQALDRLRGGESVESSSRVNGEVGNNSVEAVVSGDNTIDQRSFAGASGITTVIQNTGANVLIQNGMVVNVQFVDPAR